MVNTPVQKIIEPKPKSSRSSLVPIITDQQQMEDQIQRKILNTVKSAKRIDPRKLSTPITNISTPVASSHQQLLPQKNFQLTAQYAAYVSTLVKQPKNQLLINTITLSSENKYHQVLTPTHDDIKSNNYGTSLIVPRDTQQLQVKLDVKQNEPIQGYLSFQFRLRNDYLQTIMESLTVVDNGFSFRLGTTVTNLEIVVGEGDKLQSMVLVIIKQ